MKLNLLNVVGSYIEISGKNTWIREILNANIQFLKNLWKYTSMKITPCMVYKDTYVGRNASHTFEKMLAGHSLNQLLHEIQALCCL